MTIRLATKFDAKFIAKLHKKEISKGFLSSLGERFLTLLYEAMCVSKNAFVIVYIQNKKIEGFISGCVNVKEFFKEFFQYLIEKPYRFFYLFIKMLSIDRVRGIIEILLYPKKERDLPQAELLTIAVSRKLQGKGISRLLFNEFLNEMRKRNIKTFKVIVGENLPRAVKFYEKMGFRFLTSIYTHKDKLSRVYIYQE